MCSGYLLCWEKLHSTEGAAADVRRYLAGVAVETVPEFDLLAAGLGAPAVDRDLVAEVPVARGVPVVGTRSTWTAVVEVVPAQGGQPGAGCKARTREHEEQHAFKGQSFQDDAGCHFDEVPGGVDGAWNGDGACLSRCPAEGAPVVPGATPRRA